MLVDDIISTGTTLITVIQQLLAQGFKSPVCIGIHALFNDEIYKTLLKIGAKEIITTNSIVHPTNKIDLSDLLAEAIRQC